MLIHDTSLETIEKLKNLIAIKLDRIQTLEEAAQSFDQEIFNTFNDSIILIRTFITIPFQELPYEIQTFASDLVQKAQIQFPLRNGTIILTLLGTVGIRPEWNDRMQSKGHLGIPLLSKSFVSAIPMMSTLLEQLGFNLGWIRGEKQIMASSFGPLSGTFYVSDALTTKDTKGRLIITDQKFAKKFDVHSVFGFGCGFIIGGFTIPGKIMATIIFCNEKIEKKDAILFQSLADVFESKTRLIIKDNTKYFKSYNLFDNSI